MFIYIRLQTQKIKKKNFKASKTDNKSYTANVKLGKENPSGYREDVSLEPKYESFEFNSSDEDLAQLRRSLVGRLRSPLDCTNIQR